MRDDDDGCTPWRCFLACFSLLCTALFVPSIIGVIPSGDDIGAAEHLQEMRSMVLSGYAPGLLRAAFFSRSNASADKFSECMEGCGTSKQCHKACTIATSGKPRKRPSRLNKQGGRSPPERPPHLPHAPRAAKAHDAAARIKQHTS